ncbi:hypothetical protein ACS8E9_03860 [Pseudomonas neustonica]|uniref:Uncharacterized protein n=1 Tax=Pseudomonas neustonica TaxID=2487346 RepID=A0ABX9XKA2_9PSED|nr:MULTISPECIES: hypothetical protein [Pseudomonas]MAB23994.1 hypothetical protein [Pseudomonadales bacterium]MBA6418826.1 hypothetical protein [Pseudomonas sp. 5Ae-yellow]ROZ83129.1 hypothetical protein EF096_13310 [Pseudomonas neustonica]ROZ86801.1 hypothetical protein EF099_00150 [Pseudomonas sp. SSM44]|tara:strand:+ start:4740 stop:5033 length:294 start_codon:yes stop_codon:yes gene_type:complete
MSSLKEFARKLCAPLLKPLENSDAPYHYTPKSRGILVIMSLLFLSLATGLAVFLPSGIERTFLIPVTVFGLIGLLGLLVAWLGSERAVARLWNSKQG